MTEVQKQAVSYEFNMPIKLVKECVKLGMSIESEDGISIRKISEREYKEACITSAYSFFEILKYYDGKLRLALVSEDHNYVLLGKNIEDNSNLKEEITFPYNLGNSLSQDFLDNMYYCKEIDGSKFLVLYVYGYDISKFGNFKTKVGNNMFQFETFFSLDEIYYKHGKTTDDLLLAKGVKKLTERK